MQYELTDEYLEDARRRAYRFQGQWCGTSGSLAADVARLLAERKRMTETIASLENRNAALRAAVQERLAGTPADDPKMVGYVPAAESCCDGGKCHTKAIDERGPLTDVDEHLDEDDARTPDSGMAIPPDWILQGQRELELHSDDIRWKGDSIIATPPEALRPGSREFVSVLDEIKDLHLRKTLDYGVDDDALSNIRESADVVNMPAWAGAILRISDKMHRLRSYFRRGKTEFDGVEDTLKDISSYAAIALVLYREQAAEAV